MKRITFLRVPECLLAFVVSVLVSVFELSGATPLQIAQQALLKAPIPQRSAWFGYSVAVSGDTMVIGAPREPVSIAPFADESGAAYVFVRSGTAWNFQARLIGSNTVVFDRFGWSVAVSGDIVVVGAPMKRNSGIGSGAAYVFVRSGTNWNQQAYLTASVPGEGDRFGISVAVSGDTVVVGANQENSPVLSVSGGAYVFTRSGTPSAWHPQAYLTASNAGPRDRFGTSVAVSGETLVVGAPNESSNFAGVQNIPLRSPEQDDNSAADSGAGYVFVRSGTNWTQQAYLKAFNTGAGDRFGISVAVSDNTIVVGADQEDSAGALNSDGNNNNASNSGAAYVFVRNGAAWNQQAYLKASNLEPNRVFGDVFGSSVAVSGDTVVVGASREDSNSPGVNGDGNNNSADGAGAAYVFERSGTPVTWSHRAYLKASNPHTADYFGWSVAVSADAIVSGAYGLAESSDVFASGAAYVFGELRLPAPEIVVEQPAGTSLSNGGSVYFGVLVRDNFESSTIKFFIKNTGDADLTGLAITIDGPGSKSFHVRVSANPLPLGGGASTEFEVAFSNSDRGLNPFQSATLHLASNDGDENPFDIILTGSILTDAEECLIQLFEAFRFRPSTNRDVQIQSMPQNAPASISLGNFYALQSLMNQTGEGRRLTGLYWQHSRELVQIVLANPALYLEVGQVLLDFQPAVSALLSGNGSSVQITPAMIDQLNRAWAGFANAASPALKTALETERARFNGFQAFVGKNFSDWAGLLQVPVPAQPYIQAFNPTQQQGLFKVGANYILGLAYSLWKSANPGVAAWTPVPDARVQVNADGVELTDTNASPSALFYKVRAQGAVPGQ